MSTQAQISATIFGRNQATARPVHREPQTQEEYLLVEC